MIVPPIDDLSNRRMSIQAFQQADHFAVVVRSEHGVGSPKTACSYGMVRAAGFARRTLVIGQEPIRTRIWSGRNASRSMRAFLAPLFHRETEHIASAIRIKFCRDLLTVEIEQNVEWPGGISHPGSPRTVR